MPALPAFICYFAYELQRRARVRRQEKGMVDADARARDDDMPARDRLMNWLSSQCRSRFRRVLAIDFAHFASHGHKAADAINDKLASKSSTRSHIHAGCQHAYSRRR